MYANPSIITHPIALRWIGFTKYDNTVFGVMKLNIATNK